jgi:hypothetical protein
MGAPRIYHVRRRGINGRDVNRPFLKGPVMSRLVNSILAPAGMLIALALAAPAQSQSVPANVGARAPAGTYDLNVANGSVVVNALITTDSNGHATGISGIVNQIDPFTDLSSYAGADNDLYSSGAWVTFGGLSFSTSSLGDFNFYNSGQGYYGLLSSATDITGYPDGQVATAHVAPVPEPSSWALMLVGFGAVGAALRRSRAKVSLPQLA